MENHTHNHSHHEHHHHHGNDLHGKKLLLVTLLNLSITVVEVVGGLLSNSLSLLSDALHNLADTSALFIAFVAGKISGKAPDEKNTFGYKRVEILAALFNGLVLIAICVFLFYEAYERFKNPQPIKGGLMLVVAVFGLAANFASMIVLKGNKDENLNIKAAYLHLLGDTLSSVAVIVGGVMVIFWKVYWVDPLITVLVGLYIIYHTWDVLKETVDILMQTTPGNIDINKIKEVVESIPEVKNIHHVHVWKLNDEQIHFESHVTLCDNLNMEQMMQCKSQIETILQSDFGISHTTLQIEYGLSGCCNHNDLIYSK